MRRFWDKVQVTEVCWLWLATKNHKGYGMFYPESNRAVVAHRFAYELMIGPIPNGMQLDHLCRVRSCVNPLHLEPVTRLENVRRGLKGILHTHCAQGHAMTRENTLVHNTNRGVARKCRTCQATANRAYRARLKERAADTLYARGVGGQP